MPFTYDLSPVIFEIGPFALRWYSLVYVAGFLLAYWLLVRFAEQGRIKGLDKEGVEDYMTWLILGSILSARLFYVLVYNPSYYFANPLKVLAVWEGGMAFHGGFLGAALVSWFWTRKRKVSFYALADLLVLPLSLALVFGRIANFVNAELVGRVTDAAKTPWCVSYPGKYEGCRHPSQFYEAGQNLVTFAILLPLYVKDSLRKRLREGTIFWLFILLYGVGRVMTNFYRAPDPTDPVIGGLLLGQWFSAAMIVAALIGVGTLYARRAGRARRGRPE